jgi:hypothetical protein
MGKKNIGKTEVAASASQLIAGTNSQFAKSQKLAFASSTFTPAQVVAQLQLIVSLRAATDAAHAALAAKVSAEDTQLPALLAFMTAYIAFVKATFSGSPDVLAIFGLEPKKVTTLTVAVKAAAVVKRDATRAARGTKGTKQRKDVKGAVTGVEITPIVAGTPVVTAAPAAPSAPVTGGATSGGTPHTA